jgi:hypothetical protein
VRFLKTEIDRWLLERNRRLAGKGGPVKGEERLLPFEEKGLAI